MSNSLNQAIDQAISALQKGELGTATKYLNSILGVDVNNVAAIHLLAIVNGLQKNKDSAITLFERAIALSPNNYQLHSDYAKALTDLDLDGESLYQYQKAISLDPKTLDTRMNYSISLAKLSRFDDAIEILNTLVGIEPNFFPAYIIRSNIYQEQGNLLMALQDLNSAIALNENFYDGLCNRAFIHKEMKNYSAAIIDLNAAIRIDEKNPTAYVHKGALLYEMSDYKNALNVLEHGLHLDPSFHRGWLNRGVVLQALHRYKEALHCYDRALELGSLDSKTWSNKAICLNILGDLHQAFFCADTAISINPDGFNEWLNKGATLKNLNQPELALECYDKALTIKPGWDMAIWNRGLVNLSLGNYVIGLKEYEARWTKIDADPYRHKDIPRLSNLSDLKNKKVLCWYEQGYGDTIQFVRYLQPMMDLGAKIIVQTQEPLKQLIASSFECNVIGAEEPLPEVNLQIPLGSLPLLFESNIETIPNPLAYLKVSDEKVLEWKKIVGGKTDKLNIAIACSGNLGFDLRNGNPRNIPLEKFSQFIDYANLYLVQKDLSDGDWKYLHQHTEIVNLGPKINNFEDTAAIIMNMDLVVSIDTSIAHLAGALGISAKVLLPWVADWRWMLNTSDSPWYPSIKLYRQEKAGSWNEAIEGVKKDLEGYKKL